jgi:hypothetical protein
MYIYILIYINLYVPNNEFDAEGDLIEFTVSEPVANVAKEAPTAAPEPPDDPPGVRVRSYGLWVCPPDDDD